MNAEKFLRGDIVMLYYLYKNNDGGIPHSTVYGNSIPKLKVGDTFPVYDVDSQSNVIYKFGFEEADFVKFKYSQVSLFKRPIKNHIISLYRSIKSYFSLLIKH